MLSSTSKNSTTVRSQNALRLTRAALQAAYGRSGWLEKVAVGLIARHTNRRAQIVVSLRSLGTPAAAAALRALASAERDANLRLRLQQALHALDGTPAAGDGGAVGQGG